MSIIKPLNHTISGTTNQSYDIDASSVSADGFNPVHIETNIQPRLEELTVNVTQNYDSPQIATPPAGSYGFSKVTLTVNVPPVISLKYFSYPGSSILPLSRFTKKAYTDSNYSVGVPSSRFLIWIYVYQSTYFFQYLVNDSSETKDLKPYRPLEYAQFFLEGLFPRSTTTNNLITFYMSSSNTSGVFGLNDDFGSDSMSASTYLSTNVFKIPYLDSD